MRRQHDAPGRAAPRRQGHETDTRIVAHRERTRRAAERFFDREARQQREEGPSEGDQDARRGRLEFHPDIERQMRVLKKLVREARLARAEQAIDEPFSVAASRTLDHALVDLEREGGR